MFNRLSILQIVTRIIEMFTAIIPVNIPMSRSLMSVVSEAIEEKDVIYNSCNSLVSELLYEKNTCKVLLVYFIETFKSGLQIEAMEPKEK